MRFIKQTFKIFIPLILLFFLGVWGVDFWVVHSTNDRVYHSIEEIPINDVGLLLGTGKILSNGRLNLYYKYRIEAAAKIYHSGKIKFILISGDNSTEAYDEPTTMKKDLIEKGVPANKIYLDYAGFRTLDSVIRCKEIFGQKNITVISQKFHNERAIFIANQKGMKAIGYNARSVSKRYGLKVLAREKLARVKMLLDLVLGKQPKFLGKKIEIK